MSLVPDELHIDGVSFTLKEAHNFDWLHKLGQVFTVFDKQDSGNLSFGIVKDGCRFL